MANTRPKKLTSSIKVFMEPEMIAWIQEKVNGNSDISKFIRGLVRKEMSDEAK